ncbi:hypothetical protein KKB55_05820, partial [Myxococcota bacterium]|nr:hypothetical protein [Myxococcota bacterium]MBU1897268.1 hypothetical protein [Myxococcota bacterium]
AAQTRAALGLLRHRLAQAERGLLLQPRRALLELEARLWPQGAARLATARRALTELQGRLERATTRQVTQARANLHAQHRALGLLSPLKILDRGYSIALGAAGVVQEAAALRIGEALELRLRRGRVIVEVTEIKEHPMEDEDEHT